MIILCSMKYIHKHILKRIHICYSNNLYHMNNIILPLISNITLGTIATFSLCNEYQQDTLKNTYRYSNLNKSFREVANADLSRLIII